MAVATPIPVYKTKGTATIVVAASNSPSAIRRIADYRCDGTADEVQINAALTALGSTGGTVYLAAGSYAIAATINLVSNCILCGDGKMSILTLNDSVASDMINGDTKNNITIRDLYIDGNKQGQGAGGDYDFTIDLDTVTGVRIENCTVINGWILNIQLDDCNNVIVANNDVIAGGNDGIALGNCKNVDICNNLLTYNGFDSVTNFTGGGTHEVLVDDTLTGATSGETAIVKSITLTGGSWAAGTAAGYFVLEDRSGAFTAGGENLDEGANGNVCTLAAGDKIYGGARNAIEIQDGSENVCVFGNIIKETNIGGIEVSTHTGKPACHRVNITNNVFDGCERAINVAGLSGTQQDDVVIVGNQIRYNVNQESNQIYLSYVDDVIVSGNSCKSYWRIIRGRYTINRLSIANNDFCCLQASSNNTHQAIDIAGTLTTCHIKDNIMNNFGYQPIYFSSTPTLVDVHVTGNTIKNVGYSSGRTIHWHNPASTRCVFSDNYLEGTYWSNAYTAANHYSEYPAGWSGRDNRWNGVTIHDKIVMDFKNTSGGSLAAGDVVIMKAVAAGNECTTTTAQGNDMVLGMVLETIANNARGRILTEGKTKALKVDGTADIAIGELLGTFTTAKIARKAAAGDMAFAIALEAYTTNDSAGVIDALLIKPRALQ